MDRQIAEGAKRIREGKLVAFPTETIYGLGANALDAKACKKIFEAKERPADNPLIVHVSSDAMVKDIVQRVPKQAKQLMDAFWPGPLTIIMRKNEKIPDIVNPYKRVAVRMPDHPIALALIEQAGVPIAAPSANKSGRPSPTSAQHVREDFPDLFIIDGGRTQHGLESTVVEVDRDVRVYRLGAITFEQLRTIAPNATLTTKTGKAPKSPGMKYKHYAPKQPLIVFKTKKALKVYAAKHQGSIILSKTQDIKDFRGLRCIDLGKTQGEIAHNLFSAFRTREGKALLMLSIPKRGLGRAIMDRVERAATELRET
jgi:L-threonylcarbamoyladenylate synthase